VSTHQCSGRKYSFGELIAKTVCSQPGEYFDYDNAGRLWRTSRSRSRQRVPV